MPDDIRRIRSYLPAESEGGLGTVCIYRARADLPVGETWKVADTVRVRPDPVPAG